MIEILSSAALATVQDLGRDGHLRYGVGTSGAMDRVALQVANLLIGNEPGAAGVEVPVFPFRLRFVADCDFALTGADVDARLDDEPLPPWWAQRARRGQVLTLGAPARGARCYLALEGGVDVPLVLGSRSTQLRGEFGGYEGRTLRQGDVLRAVGRADGGAAAGGTAERSGGAGHGAQPPEFALLLGDAATNDAVRLTTVRVLPAGEYDEYDAASQQAFWQQRWKVTGQSDRYGYRLEGVALRAKAPVEKRSHGIVPGVIQVPPSGQPIIQLRDAQPSGGYPKIGTVIEADLWRLAQARPGSQLAFVEVDYEAALDAQAAVEAYLAQVRRLVGLHKLAGR